LNKMSELTECPLCAEEFDITDKNFKPCVCGYQICVWCFNKLNEESGKCPHCRRQYNLEALGEIATDPKEIIKAEKKNKKKKRKK